MARVGAACSAVKVGAHPVNSSIPTKALIVANNCRSRGANLGDKMLSPMDTRNIRYCRCWGARSGPEFDFEAGGDNAQASKDLVVDMLASMPIRGRRAVVFRQVLAVAGRPGQVLRWWYAYGRTTCRRWPSTTPGTGSCGSTPRLRARTLSWRRFATGWPASRPADIADQTPRRHHRRTRRGCGSSITPPRQGPRPHRPSPVPRHLGPLVLGSRKLATSPAPTPLRWG